MNSADRERIVLPPHPVKPENQEAIARLQRQCFVELATVQQFHAWLDDKRQCRQACLCDWGLPHGKNDKRYALATPTPVMRIG